MEEKHIVEEFRTAVRYRRLAYICVYIGLFLMIWSLISKPWYALLNGIGFIFIVTGMVIKHHYWRCPVCDKPLCSESLKNLNYCYYCGSPLPDIELTGGKRDEPL